MPARRSQVGWKEAASRGHGPFHDRVNLSARYVDSYQRLIDLVDA